MIEHGDIQTVLFHVENASILDVHTIVLAVLPVYAHPRLKEVVFEVFFAAIHDGTNTTHCLLPFLVPLGLVLQALETVYLPEAVKDRTLHLRGWVERL